MYLGLTTVASIFAAKIDRVHLMSNVGTTTGTSESLPALCFRFEGVMRGMNILLEACCLVNRPLRFSERLP